MENKNRPAYPFINTEDSEVAEVHYGLTKREYFAAKAMQGLLAGDFPEKSIHNNIGLPEIHLIACESVAYADALLKQLES